MRRFLFLQGNATPFYRMLGEALAGQGQFVRRVNYCGGDRQFWGDWNAEDFRAPPDEHRSFLYSLLQREEITDILMFGDCRPLHRDAVAVAEDVGCRVWVFEEGYLRPHWITLERHGVNGYSHLPKDPQWFRESATNLPGQGEVVETGGGLRERILYDFRWQFSNYVGLLRYPHHRTHRPYPIWAEYATWARRLIALPMRGRQARRLVRELGARDMKYALLPLQLDSDYQIRVHSSFAGIPDLLNTVIRDFAAHAPADLHLVIKNHPLDNGWIDYRGQIARGARQLNVADRVHFIDGGDLAVLLDGATGVVTANSTVGVSAIDRGAPVICLGTAIYDLAGLTFQGPLKEFWSAPGEVDRALADAFKAVLKKTCLVNGNFYTPEGMAKAVQGSLARLMAEE